MIKRFFFPFFVLLVATAAARDRAENWVEVRSAHFVVVSNASEKQTQNVADEFERMRAVFEKAFPRAQADAGSPITVIAVKSEKDFSTLEPEADLAKGQLKRTGYFLRAADSNFILLRLDAGGQHPFAVVYHEYTHYLTRKAGEWMPLWLNEGLAEFYQNTEIRDKDAVLGAPSAENIYLLRENRLLPLATLFTVDHASPYYHEENKGSIFYAESWALTHYLMTRDFGENTTKLKEYMELVAQKVDAVTAATRAFGDLNALQKTLENYVRRFSFGQLKTRGPVTISDVEFKVRPLTFAQAAAVRGEFLAYNQRGAEARALLEVVLREDPNNVSAHETMGYLAFRQGNLEDARKWYEKAVKLDSRSYLAHYYFAAMAMTGARLEPEEAVRVENSLRTAIKLNPSFAPAYDRLAVFFLMRSQNLEEAYMLTLQAVQLDPVNVVYRLNGASVLMASRRGADAIRVIQSASKVAQSPQDIAHVQSALQMAEQYQAAQAAFEEQGRGASEDVSASTLHSIVEGPAARDDEPSPPTEKNPPVLARREPQRTLTGTIQEVQCSMPAKMELKLESRGATVVLHADNYYKVRFSAVGFTPAGELHPCTELEGMNARVEFVEASGSKPGQITSVELQK